MFKRSFFVFGLIFFTLTAGFAQSKKIAKEDTIKVSADLIKNLSKKTITGNNIKEHPLINKDIVIVNYSTSSFYLVKSKND